MLKDSQPDDISKIRRKSLSRGIEYILRHIIIKPQLLSHDNRAMGNDDDDSELATVLWYYLCCHDAKREEIHKITIQTFKWKRFLSMLFFSFSAFSGDFLNSKKIQFDFLVWRATQTPSGNMKTITFAYTFIWMMFADGCSCSFLSVVFEKIAPTIWRI